MMFKIFASGVNAMFVFLSLKLLKFSEIYGVLFFAWKLGSVKFWTDIMSGVDEVV